MFFSFQNFLDDYCDLLKIIYQKFIFNYNNEITFEEFCVFAYIEK